MHPLTIGESISSAFLGAAGVVAPIEKSSLGAVHPNNWFNGNFRYFISRTFSTTNRVSPCYKMNPNCKAVVGCRRLRDA